MAEFEFIPEDGLVWVDAADIKRPPYMEHFYLIDTRPYIEKLIERNRVQFVNMDGFKIFRAYVENNVWYISSGDKLYPISKPLSKGKAWVYKKPLGKKKNDEQK